ncbi:MAG TPA: CBS domain-containing protein [Vicinamibacterales bacterium]
MRIAELMSTPARTVGLDEPASAAWEKMRLYRVRHLVVTGDGGVVGVLSDKDLGGKHGDPVRNGRLVADLMTEKVVTAAPDTTVREAANLMRGHVVDCLPVLERGKLKGIVTALDLLELIGRGAERPVAAAKRCVLKDRGSRPHAQVSAKIRHRSRVVSK